MVGRGNFRLFSSWRKLWLASPLLAILVLLLGSSTAIALVVLMDSAIGIAIGTPEIDVPSIEISYTNGDKIVELFGDISDLGESVVTTRGFVWSLSSHEVPGNVTPEDTDYEYFWVEEGIFGSEQFSHLPQDLQVNTDYYSRGFIEVDGEFIYSEDQVVFDPILVKDNQGLATLIEVLPYVFIGVVLLGAAAYTGSGILIVVSLAIAMIIGIALTGTVQTVIQTVVDLIS